MSEIQDEHNRQLLVFEGSQEDFDQIQALFESGELSKLLGIQVIDVGIVSESQRITNLSHWLEEIIEASWQTLEALFNTQAANPAFSIRTAEQSRENEVNNPADGIRRGKLIDLGIELAGNPVALVVTLMPVEASEEIDIHLRVYPTGQQNYLPPGLQLIVLDESGDSLPELKAEARSADDWIQREFSGQPGERFSVKIALGDVSIIENFMI
jgi:hypothetical protein